MNWIAAAAAAGALGLSILGMLARLAFKMGRMDAKLDAVSKQLAAPGDNAFVQRKDLIAMDGERTRVDGEIKGLRASTGQHGQQLADHEARIGALEGGR